MPPPAQLLESIARGRHGARGRQRQRPQPSPTAPRRSLPQPLGAYGRARRPRLHRVAVGVRPRSGEVRSGTWTWISCRRGCVCRMIRSGKRPRRGCILVHSDRAAVKSQAMRGTVCIMGVHDLHWRRGQVTYVRKAQRDGNPRRPRSPPKCEFGHHLFLRQQPGDVQGVLNETAKTRSTQGGVRYP